ncbi:DUF7560 family zinc ribbon protein [Halovalidus salilacus]
MTTHNFGCSECGGTLPVSPAVRTATQIHGCPYCGASISDDRIGADREPNPGDPP